MKKGLNMYKELLEKITENNVKPQIFEMGEPKFWDDPYISQKLLDAHINPRHDLASRRQETINKGIENITKAGIVKPGDKVLDLGCGPGLYSNILSSTGIRTVGLDLSERSINYAVKKAKGKNLEAEYICMDYFDMDYTNEFDTVMLVYGELHTFSDEKRDLLLQKAFNSLKSNGYFIFEVVTPLYRINHGLKNKWYITEHGFWCDEKHLVLEEGFNYPKESVWLDQYTTVTERDVKVYRNWFHGYTAETIKNVVEKAGFEIETVWNDITGTEYNENGEWMCVVLKKKE